MARHCSALADSNSVSEPDLLSVSQPDFLSVSQPDLLSISEPDLLSFSEPDFLSVSQPDLLSISEPDLLSISQPDFLSVSQPDLLSVSEPDLLSVSEPDLLSVSEPDFLSISQPDFLSISQPDFLSICEPDLLSFSRPWCCPRAESFGFSHSLDRSHAVGQNQFPSSCRNLIKPSAESFNGRLFRGIPDYFALSEFGVRHSPGDRALRRDRPIELFMPRTRRRHPGNPASASLLPGRYHSRKRHRRSPLDRHRVALERGQPFQRRHDLSDR